MPTKEELKKLQSDPLPQKVVLTKARIREWYYKWGGQVYVSFSGGKDSTVLLHLVRQEFPDVQAVFVDTGLEYPEIKQFVKQHENVTILRPKMGFAKVIRKYGYPVLSKMISHNIGIARRNPQGNIAKTVFVKGKSGKYDMHKYFPITKSDFLTSDKCCNVMKKAPLYGISQKAIIATMAVESQTREEQWIKHGCNMFDIADPKSAPMSFWTEQDVLQYIKHNNIEICSVYGDIIPDGWQLPLCDWDCKLCTTGCDRTGCVFCGYGAHLEKGEGRFQRLKRTHPKLYDYCIGGGAYDPEDGLWKPDKNGLGMAHVFDELNKLYGKDFIRYK
jgi:3'-phosphoadenosine 5'-phosphosulfate sulfotransferase (PAPS reductase)/FAD synthetase